MNSISGMICYAGDGLRRIFYLDLRMLALFRIGLGGIILIDLIQRSYSFKAHYSPAGVLPPEEALWYADFSALLPLHLWFSSDSTLAFLFILQAVAAVLLVIGVQTRFATIACWILVNSLQLRNPVLLYGADRELAALLLWAMFLPLGAKWSLDARQRCRWAGMSRISGFAAAGLILQVLLIYATSVLSKSGETWRDGSAILLALNVDAYTRPLGRWLLQFGEYLWLLTYITLIIESIASFMLLAGKFERIRWIGCLSLIGLQFGFFVFLSVGLFPWISMVAIMALIPLRPSFNGDGVEKTGRRFGVLIEGAVALLVVMMVVWQVALVPLQFRNSALMGKMPDTVAWIYKVSRLAQSWSMFSPDPPDRDGWFVLECGSSNKESVDLLRSGSTVDWKKPHAVDRMFESERWKEWMLKVHLRGLKWNRTIDHLVQNYFQHHSIEPSQQSAHIRLWYLEESYDVPDQTPSRHLLFEKSYMETPSDP